MPRSSEQEIRTEAYATILEATDTALEVRTGGMVYVVGQDGKLWEAESNDDPETITAKRLDELLTFDNVYVIDRGECWEFEEILPDSTVFY